MNEEILFKIITHACLYYLMYYDRHNGYHKKSPQFTEQKALFILNYVLADIESSMHILNEKEYETVKDLWYNVMSKYYQKNK